MHLVVHFIDGYEWQRREHEFARPFDTAEPAPIWEGVKRGDAVDNRSGDPTRGMG